MESHSHNRSASKPGQMAHPRKPLNTSSKLSSISKKNSGSQRQANARLPWLDDSRITHSGTKVAGLRKRNNSHDSPISRSITSDRASLPHHSQSNDLIPIRKEHVRTATELSDSLDGNTTSAPLEHAEPLLKPDGHGGIASSSSEQLIPHVHEEPSTIISATRDTENENEPTIRLHSLVEALRPTESSRSTAPDSRAGTAPGTENIRASISESIPMKPVETYNLTNRTLKRPLPEDSRLRDSITRLEELAREAVYLAHDAVGRQRSDQVSRIIDKAADALHSSTYPQDFQTSTRDEPLIDVGGNTPGSGKTHRQKGSGDLSVLPRASLRDVEPVARAPLEEASTPFPFSDEPSPYHPPNLADPKAMDFAYGDRIAPEQISPSSTLPLDVRRRSKPKAQFEDPSGQRDPRSDLPTSPEEHGESPYFPRNSSITVRRPRESSSSSSAPPTTSPGAQAERIGQIAGHNWGSDKYDEKDYLSSDDFHGRHHVTLNDDQPWSIHHHKRQPIARNWSTLRKRTTAIVVCINTFLIGFIIGIYAGEVPAIQYSLVDLDHRVILGNVVLYIGMAITTFLFWPLPLLHGRKPYTLVALGIALPLQFPQAVMVGTRRVGDNSKYMVGLLVPRALVGLALGFCHVNLKTTLLDVFGASLQSSHPHGEVVVVDDVRRHGGGMGLWLGLWSFSFIGSLALGFMIGADIISGLNVSWGFYITVALIAGTLFLDVLTPETRRAPHRRTMAEIELSNMKISRRVARGEIRMHVFGDGPKWWWEEVYAGILLSVKMLDQPGFGLMALYLGWVYGEIVLIIVLLGNLLSIGYLWRPQYVGSGVLSIFVGALLAIPNTKANFFSKSRVRGGRTDSMTFEPRVTWTSHMVRRAAFMTLLPLAGIAYTLASAGPYIQFMLPIIFSGLIGYISNLAIAECHGLIMEAFDTCDLQPGANSKHRLQSLPAETLSRRTTYSSYPRVTAGLMTAHSIGFAIAAAATGVGGAVTRQIGARKATGITAGVLFGLTILLTICLWRFKKVKVIPNHLFGDYFGSTEGTGKRDSLASMRSDKSWRAVVVGNPSGKYRRMNLLELGGLSRWTEIRRLNRLLDRKSTQPLNPGWQ